MKRVLPLLASLLAVTADSYFLEDFENGPASFASGATTTWGNSGATLMGFSSGFWVANNLSSPLGTTGWFNNSSLFPPNGGACMLNADNDNGVTSGPINNWIMTPVIKPNNGDKITFWTRTVSNPLFPARLLVKLSQQAGSVNPADFTTTLLTINPQLTTTGYPNAWTKITITFVGLPVNGCSSRVAFVFQGSGGLGGSERIGIDDVGFVP